MVSGGGEVEWRGRTVKVAMGVGGWEVCEERWGGEAAAEEEQQQQQQQQDQEAGGRGRLGRRRW